MLIQPDSIPPGLEWLIVSLVPIAILGGKLVPATVQLIVIEAVMMAALFVTWRLSFRLQWLCLILPFSYVLSVFSSNMLLFLCFWLTQP